MKDGIELVPGDKIKIEALDDNTQRLTIEDVDMLSQGYFRCVATNEYGTASTKAELTVTGWYKSRKRNKTKIYLLTKNNKKNNMRSKTKKAHMGIYWELI